MAGAPDTGLEGRLAQLEAQVRSLMTANWTDRASVVDASGNPVALSSLAFGQVAAVLAQSQVGLRHPVSGRSTLYPSPGFDSSTPANWLYLADPHVDVLVTGKRLRIDWGGGIAVSGVGDAATSGDGKIVYHEMSYALDYMGAATDPAPAASATGARVRDPESVRSVEVRDNAHFGNNVQAGTFYIHTGLTPGWYRAYPALFYGYYASTNVNGQAYVDYPRIAATPY